jgi:ABC-type antimicrobial peptide transport system permease subunit
MKSILFDHASNDGKALRPEGVLLPMRDWHLRSEFQHGRSAGGRIQLVRLLALISGLVIALACVNFVNLHMALAINRAKETGVRMVMGSRPGDLITRFLLESVMLVLLAFVLAILGAALALPWFNELTEKQIAIPLMDGVFWGAACVFIIVITLISGAFPALFLTSQDVTQLLRQRIRWGNGLRSVALRKGLVIFQFGVSVVLIIGTQVIYNQIKHARNRPAGFDTERIVHVAIRSDQLADVDYNIIRQSLLASGVVENAAKSDFPITGAMAGDASIRWEGMDTESPPLFARNRCSHDFPATHKFQFLSGRDFSRDYLADSSAVIINEMAAKLIGGEVLGKKISFGHANEREIVGVIKDQVRWGPYREQSPHLYYVGYDNSGYYSVRLKSGVVVADALTKVESIFRQFAPGAPFDYTFADDDYNRLFIAEERAGKVAFIFSLLAILISSIGIFGLAAFSASQRTKEIGIRKVVGASSYQIWRLLSCDFIGLSLIAILAASPIAYVASGMWLDQFSYRTELTWRVFAMATLITLLITLVTVSYQTLRAAYTNPSKSLRTD